MSTGQLDRERVQNHFPPADVEQTPPAPAHGYAVDFDPTVLKGGSPFVRPADLVRQHALDQENARGTQKHYIFADSLEEAQAIITRYRRQLEHAED